MPSSVMLIKNLSTVSDLYKIEHEWNRLLAKSSASFSFFLTWEWIISWLETYGEFCELFVVTVRNKNNQLIAIAPLKISDFRLPLIRCRISVLQFIGDGNRPTPEYIDFIVDKDFEKEIYPKLIEHILETCPCDFINFRSVFNESFLLQALSSRVIDKKYYYESFSYSNCPIAILPKKKKDFWQSKSKNFKKKMKEANRRCKRDLDIKFQCCSSIDEIDAQIEQLFLLHDMRWKKYSIGETSHSFKEFHKALSKRIFDKNWLRLFFITSDNQPVAGILCYKFQGQYFYYQSGRNPGFGYYNLGSVILNHAMEQAIQENISIFDFLTGDEPYKYRWATDNRHTKQVYIFKKRVLFYIFHSYFIVKKGLKKVYSRLPLSN